MSNRNERRPDELSLDMNHRILQIKWMDGHISQYDFDYLRRKCPCAECRPWIHGAAPVGAVPDSVKTASGDIAGPQHVQFVGSYAVTIQFADGHGAGIYTWPYLREICPCGQHGESDIKKKEA
ncbi:MAG: DUF971 domain-containing protein [Chloroflexi bacterium]|nr:DUF971 domain-containing protein [Chloroflexota bacterium]